jgi:glyoxylase-like metal-dependent hydrolase (beta-lactamase superfamily II)
MSAETHRFTIGAFECIALLDGQVTYAADKYFANAPADELAVALGDHGVDPERIPSPYSGLVINTGRRLVLIDTGAGDFAPGLGRLHGNLLSKGIAPEAIDTVVLTHAHPDHLGGNTDAAGQPVFRNARQVLMRAEWDYWMAEPSPVHPKNQPYLAFARKNLLPVQAQIDLLDGEAEIAPGIHAIPAPGHTPGQMAVAVVSGDDELLYISDAALHPIHLEQPDWYPVYDLDPEQAVAGRRRLFDRAAAERALVLAFHFDPFPSLGHVVRAGRGWQWQPVLMGTGAADGAAETSPMAR